MKIDEKVVNRILEAELLSNIGEPYLTYPSIKNLNKVNKSIGSIKWENICLEEINNVTGFLSVNYPNEYNQFWNYLVRNIKENVIPKITIQLNNLLNLGKITESIKESVLFDMVNIIMVNSYSQYTQSEFYKEMCTIYLNGHLPYGWKGKYPQGNIEVY